MTKKKKIIIGAIALLILIITIVSILNKPKTTYTTEKVERKTLIQTVSETGAIKSANEMDLNFQNTGKIGKIYVKVGDNVSSSQILAELEYKDLSIRAKDAMASLDIARANLNKLTTGATQYEINTKEVIVEKAKTEYESALAELEEVKKSVKDNISQTENDSLITAESSLSKAQVAMDNVNTILTNSEASNLLGVMDNTSLNRTKTLYTQTRSSIISSRTYINNAKTTKSRQDIITALSNTINTLNNAFDTLTNCYQTLEASITSNQFTQSDLDGFKTIISGQETIISTSLSSIQTILNTVNNNNLSEINGTISGNQQITSAQSKVNSYYGAWKLAEAQLNELKAPARNQDITLYSAQVRQAESNLETIRNQIENSIIRAPIDGIITQIEYKKGEQVSSLKPAIKMLSENKLDIEVDISESDITKLQINAPAEITLDALSSDQKLYGIVYDIDPAETVIQDVIYYKIKIAFDIPTELNQEIKPGMTANVVITTKKKDSVLVVPSRAIIEKNGDGKFIKILDENKKVKEISIKTGIYGDDGMVEVLSGLNDGQEIITSSDTKK